jgi:hypothetical protein
MGNFFTYLITHRPLLEVTELFPRQAMNELFQREIRDALPRVEDPHIKEDLESLSKMDFVGYIDRALRNASIGDEELDEMVQRVVVKLLVSPGSLFRGWNLSTPMTARLKLAVRNSAITIGERTAKRRKRTQELSPDLPAGRAGSTDDLVHEFRLWLRLRYGETAVRVFDARLAGEDIKGLIGTDGIPSAYALKRIVQGIKAGAMAWTKSDPELNFLVQKMMDAEAGTVAKRLGRKEPQPTR